MKRILLSMVFWMLLAGASVWGQTDSSSKHLFKFYIDDEEKTTADIEILVVVAGDTIKSKKIEGFYYFPFIDSTKQFDMIVRVNNLTFSGQRYPGWMLNNGTRITFGKLTKLKKLESVADYNSTTKKDVEWEWYSKRFFVANHVYTLDIENRNKIRELRFLIISVNGSSNLVTTQKIFWKPSMTKSFN